MGKYENLWLILIVIAGIFVSSYVLSNYVWVFGIAVFLVAALYSVRIVQFLYTLIKTLILKLKQLSTRN